MGRKYKQLLCIFEKKQISIVKKYLRLLLQLIDKKVLPNQSPFLDSIQTNVRCPGKFFVTWYLSC